MLKRKHAWRTWLRLPGELWYYAEETSPQPSKLLPFMPHLISIVALCVTGILSYRTLTFNQGSYLDQHRPKISLGAGGFYRFASNEEGIAVVIRNTGDTLARHIHTIGYVQLVTLETSDSPTFSFDTEALVAGGAAFTRVPFKVPGPAQLVKIYAEAVWNDSINRPQGPEQMCIMYSSATDVLPCH